jgi:hypothetical protein
MFTATTVLRDVGLLRVCCASALVVSSVGGGGISGSAGVTCVGVILVN